MTKTTNLLARAFMKASFMIEPPEPPKGHIDISDEYTKWLCFANAGMLDRGNLYLIDAALRRLKSESPMVEIGSFCGLSANILTYYKQKYGLKNRLITCDKWDFEITESGRKALDSFPVSFVDYTHFVRDSYLRNTAFFSACDLPYTVEVTSDDFFAQWQSGETVQDVRGRTLQLGGPISFCYVDGNHSYDVVKRDFLNCDVFLERGGFILFDDSTEEIFGVRELMPEVLATGRYTCVATNPNHLFQKLDP